MRGLTFIFLLAQLPLFGFVSRIGKGYEALKIHDYFKAKSIFTHCLNRNPTEASFGLATIFYRNNNPFHNLDSAYKYGMKAKFSFDYLTLEKKKKLLMWGITDSSVQQLCEMIFRDSYQKLINTIRNNENNTVLLADQYLSYFEFSSFKNSVQRLRDDFLVSEIKKANSSEAYTNFLIEWPESIFLKDINYLLEKAFYEEETGLQTQESFLNFIEKHPQSPFKSKAEEELYFLVKKLQNKSGLYNFIKRFPENEHVSEAWKLFFTLSVDHYSPEELAEFILDYPEFPFKNSIVQEIQLAGKQLIRVKLGEKFGYVDTIGNWAVKPDFDELTTFQEGLAVALQDEKYGYINKNGEWMIPAQFEEAENFQDGVGIAVINSKPCLIDRNGQIINNEFEEINNFSNGLAVVKRNNRFGAINRLGKLVIPLNYEKLGDFHEGHAICSQEGKFGIIDKNNFLNIKIEYEWIDEFNELMRAKKNGFYGVITNQEQLVLPFEFERIETTKCNAFLVIKNGKYGFADFSGCLITAIENDFDNKLQPDELCKISNSNDKQLYFKLMRDGEEGIINQNGKVIVEPGEFLSVKLPSEGILCGNRKENFEYFNLKLEKIIRQAYAEAEPFTNGKAIVRKKGQSFIIDKNGKEMFSDGCEQIERQTDENGKIFFIVTKNGLKGLVSNELKWLILPEFTEIKLYLSGYFELQKDSKNMLFSIAQNKIIWRE
jgi:WG containing repeat